MNLRSTISFFAAVLISSLIGIGCEGVLSTQPSEVSQLKLSTHLPVGNAGTQLKAAMPGLTIDSARILVRSVKLHHEEDIDSLDFQSGSFVLILKPDEPIQEVALNEIPFGVYDKFSFKIHKPEEEEASKYPDFVDGEHRYSIIVDGTFENEPFVYRSRKSYKQVVEFDSSLVINENTPEFINVTLEVDIYSWFEDEEGVIDPFLEENAERIDKAIKRSFRIFKDNDEDGKDDDRIDGDHDDEDDKKGDEDEGDEGDHDDFEPIEIHKHMESTQADSDAVAGLVYIEEKEWRKFKVEVEDLDEGTYELIVGDDTVAYFEVSSCEEGTEGEVEFRDPEEEGKLYLSFNPLEKKIEIAREGVVYFVVEL